jgi:hypothetical protein
MCFVFVLLSVVSFIIPDLSVDPARSYIAFGCAPLFIQYAPRVRTRAAFSRTTLSQHAGLRCFMYCTHLVCVPAPLASALPWDKVQARRFPYSSHLVCVLTLFSYSTTSQQVHPDSHLVRTLCACPRLLFAAIWLRPNMTIRELTPIVPL